MSRGPVPSQLCLLSSLPDRPSGEKVRFLGCVTSYSTASASLTVGHRHPKGTNVTVSVNVELVLETLRSELTRIGEWVNVIGYVTAKPKDPAAISGGAGVPSAYIQALLLWPTGPLDVQQYEKRFEE
ncbi:hypothetical protein TOPH_05687 [Tolypocladium ophioglossoides CBS 100239]|uniref:Uncharacterized protein n=1 Tax=Tolypocladium ophioglossoides (strain CBS 100239) TaxID=1163406 RepID=A0A0L0N6J9_TOLOC|nr:hypothetical protein TOPH_05687 [Tolypocladium ophioglossoides CBS 100239]